jgi:hypothetical protein
MTDTGSQRQRPTACKKHRKRVITYSMQHLGQRGIFVLSAWGAVVVWWQLVRVLTLTERLVENTLLPFFVWKGFRPASRQNDVRWDTMRLGSCCAAGTTPWHVKQPVLMYPASLQRQWGFGGEI